MPEQIGTIRPARQMRSRRRGRPYIPTRTENPALTALKQRRAEQLRADEHDRDDRIAALAKVAAKLPKTTPEPDHSEHKLEVARLVTDDKAEALCECGHRSTTTRAFADENLITKVKGNHQGHRRRARIKAEKEATTKNA